jgi:hypothetical protein
MEALYQPRYRAVKDLLLNAMGKQIEVQTDIINRYSKADDDRTLIAARKRKCFHCLKLMEDLTNFIVTLGEDIAEVRTEIRWLYAQLSDLQRLRNYQPGRYVDLSFFLMSPEMREHLSADRVRF